MPNIDKVKPEFKIKIDYREQKKYTFSSYPVTSVKSHLITGDYSAETRAGEPMDKYISIERKSVEDLYKSLSSSSCDRFEAEWQRLSCLKYGAIVIEGNIEDILKYKSKWKKITPALVMRKILEWSLRYKEVNVFFTGTRENAECIIYNLLAMFLKRSGKL